VDSFGSKYGPVGGSREHGNEPWGSIRKMLDWWLLEEDSAPWNYLFGLFKDAVCNSGYLPSNVLMVVNDGLKRHRRTRSWPTLIYYNGICLSFLVDYVATLPGYVASNSREIDL
jgi:hypothetical protein